MRASYEGHAKSNVGYAGKSGWFRNICPLGFMPVGAKCLKLPLQRPAIFEEIKKVCAVTSGELYKPTDPLQKMIMRAYMELQGVTEMWIHVVKVDGEWLIAGKHPITQFEDNWANGQPSEAGECAYVSAAADYKWKAGNCENFKPFYCELKEPDCPDGYTWIPTTLNSCFKKYQLDRDVIASEITANKMCARDHTRLAVIETEDEKEGISNWADKDKRESISRTYYLDYRKKGDHMILSRR